jgi:hypothetical protein
VAIKLPHLRSAILLEEGFKDPETPDAGSVFRRRWQAKWQFSHDPVGDLGRAAHGHRGERMGREASPSAALLDSQSVKSAEKGAAKTM